MDQHRRVAETPLYTNNHHMEEGHSNNGTDVGAGHRHAGVEPRGQVQRATGVAQRPGDRRMTDSRSAGDVALLLISEQV